MKWNYTVHSEYRPFSFKMPVLNSINTSFTGPHWVLFLINYVGWLDCVNPNKMWIDEDVLVSGRHWGGGKWNNGRYFVVRGSKVGVDGTMCSQYFCSEPKLMWSTSFSTHTINASTLYLANGVIKNILCFASLTKKCFDVKTIYPCSWFNTFVVSKVKWNC